MHAKTLVTRDELASALGSQPLVIVDCRHDLRDPQAGERAYLAGHLPGAVFAHVDRDLSDLGKTGRGRHPLPDADVLCGRLGRWGISRTSQVVVYDAADGAFAARLWWLLRLLGHEKVAVLDGGYAAWAGQGLPIEKTIPRPRPAGYTARYDVKQIATIAVIAARGAVVGGAPLIDARAPERYRGEVEPIDAVAGHIPGAVNRHYAQNLDVNGRFKPAGLLATEFRMLIGPGSPADVVHMCGSGVTACHNLLAMEHAGLKGSRVYAGSWSEWSSDPSRPVARGEEPKSASRDSKQPA
ncbi:sulfurtransferase [Pseudomarimonas salicorniae]|uniref:Sulfurtransferase n=1 Tax=Pseudomarimonas salicorniae TaxID=2933270 RepID=A0ABT0GMP6_9GAMM|nr:sulfurtransferase [Lysobacter sp. CAU 1642]MCK7595272.1 sulfurtransferase [Lysobacter sp. CAU 1642]